MFASLVLKLSGCQNAATEKKGQATSGRHHSNGWLNNPFRFQSHTDVCETARHKISSFASTKRYGGSL
jgi:hypothetical protein